MFYHFMWVSFPKCMIHIDLTNERVSIKECPKESVASTPLNLMGDLN